MATVTVTYFNENLGQLVPASIVLHDDDYPNFLANDPEGVKYQASAGGNYVRIPAAQVISLTSSSSELV